MTIHIQVTPSPAMVDTITISPIRLSEFAVSIFPGLFYEVKYGLIVEEDNPIDFDT